MPKRDNVLARPLAEQTLPPEQYQPDSDAVLPNNHSTRARWYVLNALDRQRLSEYHNAYRFASVAGGRGGSGTRPGADTRLKVIYGEIARVEHQQAIRLTLIEPAAEPLQRALARGLSVLDCFVALAQQETDANVRAGLEYVALEMLEHAWHIGEAVRLSGGDPSTTCPIIPLRRGRPLNEQYLAAFDAVKAPYSYLAADPLTRTNVRIATALARALEDDCRQLVFGPGWPPPFQVSGANPQHSAPNAQPREGLACTVIAGTLLRVQRAQEVHVAFLESLLDPSESPLESLVAGEYAEALTYRRVVDLETEPALVKIYRHHLADEIGHLTLLTEELRRREGRDLTHLLEEVDIPLAPTKPPAEFLELLVQTQLKRRSKGKSYVDIGKTLEAYS